MESASLFHETSFAVASSINLGIQLVHHAWLRLRCRVGAGVGLSSAEVTSRLVARSNLTICPIVLASGTWLIPISVRPKTGRRIAHMLVGNRCAVLMLTGATWQCVVISTNAVGGGVHRSWISASVVGSACTRRAFLVHGVTTKGTRLALEEVTPLLTAAERSTLFFEVVHADGWKG